YRPATFDYVDFTAGSNEVLEMEYVAGDPGGTAPSGIATISTAGHYLLFHRSGTAPSSVTHNLTLRYTDTGFSPETRNRILVQNGAGPDYTVPSSQSHTEVSDDVTANGITALPTDDGKLAFGSGGATVTSAQNGNWNTASTWDIGVPTSSDDVVIGHTVTVQSGNTASANSLTLNNGAHLILANAAPGINVGGTGWDEGSTTINSGSTVEYQAGNVHADEYANLIINGASVSDGTGTISVNGNLTKNSSTAFSASHTIIVTGTYTNTLGDMSFTTSTSNRIDGAVTLTAGTVSGILDLNSPTITINGGSFGGTVTLSHTAQQSIGGTGSPSFANLTINNSAGVVLNAATSVSGALTLTSGNITTTTTYLLTLGSSASVSGGSASSFVNGPMAHTGTSGTKFFPIGKGTEYRPIEALNITGTDPVLQAEMFPSDPNGTPGTGLTNISTVRYWEGRLNSGDLTGFQIRLHWGANDGVDGQLTNLRVATSSSVSGTYEDQGYSSSSGSSESGWVESNTFAPSSNPVYLTFADAANDNSLPVELVSFEALTDVGEVTLKWKTASELNNMGFNIYRTESENPDELVQVNEELIPGQGTYPNETDYIFTDKQVKSGKSYTYKLESVSLTGVRVEEKVVDVEVPLPDQYVLFNNYPNPFNPETTIRFQLPETQRVKLVIYDIRGTVVKTLVNSDVYSAGDHRVVWDATDQSGNRVASGMYIYSFQAGKFNKIGKMILLK
ncbi:MAG TPA: T9SS type A sorting domain-containing protein, partial [Calditrichaeota bacterium]|nr:T9SS type A sorting domain-containing protein [Calditrichota bacterium]